MHENILEHAERITSALLQYKSGVPIYAIMRNYAISEDTLFDWHTRFQNMNLEQLKYACLLEAENAAIHRHLDSPVKDYDHQPCQDVKVSSLNSVLST